MSRVAEYFLWDRTRPRVSDAEGIGTIFENIENAIKKVKNKTTLAASEIECDCIGHSYGTVVLTGFRKYYRDVVRRSVFIDPVCFVPSFGRYLKYAFEEHLHAGFNFSSYIRTKIKKPRRTYGFYERVYVHVVCQRRSIHSTFNEAFIVPARKLGTRSFR